MPQFLYEKTKVIHGKQRRIYDETEILCLKEQGNLWQTKTYIMKQTFVYERTNDSWQTKAYI